MLNLLFPPKLGTEHASRSAKSLRPGERRLCPGLRYCRADYGGSPGAKRGSSGSLCGSARRSSRAPRDCDRKRGVLWCSHFCLWRVSSSVALLDTSSNSCRHPSHTAGPRFMRSYAVKRDCASTQAVFHAAPAGEVVAPGDEILSSYRSENKGMSPLQPRLHGEGNDAHPLRGGPISGSTASPAAAHSGTGGSQAGFPHASSGLLPAGASLSAGRAGRGGGRSRRRRSLIAGRALPVRCRLPRASRVPAPEPATAQQRAPSPARPRQPPPMEEQPHHHHHHHHYYYGHHHHHPQSAYLSPSDGRAQPKPPLRHEHKHGGPPHQETPKRRTGPGRGGRLGPVTFAGRRQRGPPPPPPPLPPPPPARLEASPPRWGRFLSAMLGRRGRGSRGALRHRRRPPGTWGWAALPQPGPRRALPGRGGSGGRGARRWLKIDESENQ